MKLRSSPIFHRDQAFTRAELTIVVLVLGLIATIVLPALANTRPRSERVICANNLRQIGIAMHLWGDAHGDLVPFDVALSNGGTLGHGLAPNAWLHLSWISNELASPNVLFCPSDTGRPARDFSGDPTGGYLHPNFANRSTSYFLAHTSAAAPSPSLFPDPAGILSGDRNLTLTTGGGCSRFAVAARLFTAPPTVGVGWSTNLHGLQGNLLYFDGQVEPLTNEDLRRTLLRSRDVTGQIHVLLPR